MSSFPNDPFLVYKRKGDRTDPFLQYNEPKQVYGGKVVLTEIPDKGNHVTVKDSNNISYAEVLSQASLSANNVYYVDYDRGIVYFDASKEGLQFTFSYLGIGGSYIPATRVYTQSLNGTITQDVQDMIDNYNQLNGTDLYNLFDPQTGHKHTGGVGDAPAIDSQYVTYNNGQGTVSKVKDTLDSHAAQLASKAQQSDLNTTNTNVSNNTNAIASLGSGSPKGTYSTLSALQTAFPTGTTGIYLVTADGKWYFWNGTAWTAGGVYQSTSIPDASITGKQTNFMSVGKNLFNSATVTVGYYVSYSDGTLQPNVSYYASDYIPVQANTTYTRYICKQMAFYDVNKVYISGINTTGVSPFTFTTPTNTAYIRISMGSTTDLNNEQVELGSTRTAYIPFAYVINQANLSQTALSNALVNGIGSSQMQINSVGTSQLQDNTISPAKTTFMTTGKNLFDQSIAIPNYYVSKDNGTLISSSSYYVSDWIKIQPSTQYARVENSGQFAFYDANKNYISGGSITRTFTTPSNAFYMRESVGNANLNLEQLELGSVSTPYTPYSFTLPKLQVNNSNVGLGIISQNNLNFNPAILQVGKNQFNKDTATSGYYVDSASGNVYANSGYYVSDWIPVQANTQYTYNIGNRIAIYNTNKTFIIGYNGQATFTTPSNGAYIRISIPNANINTAQVELGATATTYQSFGYAIDKLIVPQASDYFDLMLPKELCIAVGRTIELYNKQVCQCGNINNYHFSWSCDIGVTMKRKWTVTATSAMVGNHTLTLNVYDNNVNLVATGTTTIKIVNITTPISTPKNVLCMGDSLTASKPWLNEWKSLSDSMFGSGKLQFIGTQGTDPYKNEGYSGWATNNFSTNFVSQIVLTVSGVTTPPSSKKNYTVPDTQGSYTWNVESTNIVAGSGTITLNINAGVTRTPLASGTITATDGAGTGDSSITYSSYVVGKTNPFWNSGTSQLDFNNYLTVNSFSRPDIVQIFLGANELGGQIGGYSTVSSAIQTTINNMKTIVDKILSQWAGTKIYIVLTPFYADQNGLGLNYGSNNINNELQMHMNVYTIAKLMMAQFNTYNSAVTIVPVAQTMDSDYAYTPVQQAVNPRSAITELVQTGMVHPDNEGYYQMADTMFSHFVGHYLDS